MTKLRIAHFPQVPCTPFYVPVPDLQHAVLIMSTLCLYDLHQYEHNIKGDYANMCLLEQYDESLTDQYLAELGLTDRWIGWDIETPEGDYFDDPVVYLKHLLEK